MNKFKFTLLALMTISFNAFSSEDKQDKQKDFLGESIKSLNDRTSSIENKDTKFVAETLLDFLQKYKQVLEYQVKTSININRDIDYLRAATKSLKSEISGKFNR